MENEVPNGNMVNLNVDQRLIAPIIQKQIQAAIVAGLSNGKGLLEMAVANALQAKVSHNGTVSSYSSDNKHEWLEVMARNVIQDAAKAALVEYFTVNKDAIKKAVVREITKAERKGSLAKAFADAVEKAIGVSLDYRLTVTATTPKE